MPTALFWDKMQRFLFGTFHNFEDQCKMAAKFSEDNEEYVKFVKKLIHIIDEIDEDRKIDYFASLTRSFLLSPSQFDKALFFKLAKLITLCTSYELDYLKDTSYEAKLDNSAFVSARYQYGLFSQYKTESEEIKYILSDFARALKQNSLNFKEEFIEMERFSSYNQLAPINITEPITLNSIKKLADNNEIILNGGNAFSK